MCPVGVVVCTVWASEHSRPLQPGLGDLILGVHERRRHPHLGRGHRRLHPLQHGELVDPDLVALVARSVARSDLRQR